MYTYSILVANEPRAYREVIDAVLTHLRPQIKVIVLEPNEVDQGIAQHAPLLVLCNELTPGLRGDGCAWVMLYPNGAREVTIHVGGTETTQPDLDFNGLLHVIDCVIEGQLTG